MMATLPSSSSSFFFFFFWFILLLFLAHTRTSFGSICEITSCQSTGVSIGFPFGLSEVNQSRRCAYPGFELTCNGRNQPLLTLPQESGDVVVKFISYPNQNVWVNDPDECLPRRFLINQGLRLEGSPFLLGEEFTLVNYSFLNCPTNVTSLYRLPTIRCLSSDIKNLNYSVLALLSDPPFSVPWTSLCQLIASAWIPVARVGTLSSLFWTGYLDNIQLQWNDPDCGFCEANGGQCGLLGDTSLRVGCYNLQSQGPSSKVKYGISIGLGIPGLLVIIGIAGFLYSKTKMHVQRRQAVAEFSTSIIPQPSVVVMGLDGASIERYPITQLGESGRLPRPNDNICSICLCEYQPKEVLRTIPECNHYFHSNCIDGWLKMNATCPLCRNLPERSSSSIPSSLPFSPSSQ